MDRIAHIIIKTFVNGREQVADSKEQGIWIVRNGDKVDHTQVTALFSRLLIGIRPDLNTPRFPTNWSELQPSKSNTSRYKVKDTIPYHTKPNP